MKLFLLKSEEGFYKRRNQWVDDPEQATIWTTKQGAASSKGQCFPQPFDMEILEFEVELPEFVTA